MAALMQLATVRFDDDNDLEDSDVMSLNLNASQMTQEFEKLPFSEQVTTVHKSKMRL